MQQCPSPFSRMSMSTTGSVKIVRGGISFRKICSILPHSSLNQYAIEISTRHKLNFRHLTIGHQRILGNITHKLRTPAKYSSLTKASEPEIDVPPSNSKRLSGIRPKKKKKKKKRMFRRHEKNI